MAECFEPIARSDARVLILGSVPGEASLAAGQYYAHPRNAFWPIMEALFGDGSALDYPSRVALVLDARAALWDVLASADRMGSLDAAIDGNSEVPNDIPGFLDAHTAITHVFFNGAKAQSSFDRHLKASLPAGRVSLARLPSTSPANAAASFDSKLAAWRAVADAVRA
jgi:TDG/mug DNA glycosylase family protein